MDDVIPLARPVLGLQEERAVIDVLRSGQLSLGPRVGEFERAFAARLGAPFASAVSSGTAGLHLALRAANVHGGDEVVTSPFSFVASANAALYERARPVFADIDRRTLNLDPQAAAAAVTERTRALLPVHIFGYPADMPAFERIAAARDLTIVEDACEALGARHADGPAVAARAEVAERYRQALDGIEGLELPCADAGGDVRGWFVFVVQLPRGVDRDDTVRALAASGIQSKPYLPAIHLMSFYRERFGHREGQFPVCEDIAARSLALPFFPEMTEAQVARVAHELRTLLHVD